MRIIGLKKERGALVQMRAKILKHNSKAAEGPRVVSINKRIAQIDKIMSHAKDIQ